MARVRQSGDSSTPEAAGASSAAPVDVELTGVQIPGAPPKPRARKARTERPRTDRPEARALAVQADGRGAGHEGVRRGRRVQPEPVRALPMEGWPQLLWIGLIVICLFVIVALGSFDVSDQMLVSDRTQIHNRAGALGAWAAAALYGGLGWGAWAVVVVAVWAGLRLAGRQVGGLLNALLLAGLWLVTLVALGLWTDPVGRDFPAGGWLGGTLAGLLAGGAGQVGASLLVSAAALGVVTLLFRIDWQPVASRVVQGIETQAPRVARKIGEAGVSAVQASVRGAASLGQQISERAPRVRPEADPAAEPGRAGPVAGPPDPTAAELGSAAIDTLPAGMMAPGMRTGQWSAQRPEPEPPEEHTALSQRALVEVEWEPTTVARPERDPLPPVKPVLSEQDASSQRGALTAPVRVQPRDAREPRRLKLPEPPEGRPPEAGSPVETARPAETARPVEPARRDAALLSGLREENDEIVPVRARPDPAGRSAPLEARPEMTAARPELTPARPEPTATRPEVTPILTEPIERAAPGSTSRRAPDPDARAEPLPSIAELYPAYALLRPMELPRPEAPSSPERSVRPERPGLPERRADPASEFPRRPEPPRPERRAEPAPPMPRAEPRPEPAEPPIRPDPRPSRAEVARSDARSAELRLRDAALRHEAPQEPTPLPVMMDAPLVPIGPMVMPGNMQSGGTQDDGRALREGWGFELPPLSMLDEHPVSIVGHDDGQLQELGRKLAAKLRTYGVEGQVVAIRPGPVITMFEYEPAPGVKLSKISSLSDDLKMALEAVSVRIVAPIPGAGWWGWRSRTGTGRSCGRGTCSPRRSSVTAIASCR